MTVETEAKRPLNGVEVGALLDARTAIDASPELGDFTFRAEAHWLGGTHCRTKIDGFFGLSEEQIRKRPHVIDGDHPEQFAAADQGAAPVEIVLAALASCLTAGVASVAENRGITLRSVSAKLEGDMDLAGVLGADSDARLGFTDIRVAFAIDADATEDEISAVVAQSQRRSAVFDILTNPTNVHATAAKL